MAKAKVNRSEVIRNILQDIGAVSKDAPAEWAKTVTTKLGKMGIKVSPPMIYQVRTKEMVKAGLAVKSKRPRKTAPKAKAVGNSHKPRNGGNYDVLFAVKKLSDQLGGLDQLDSAIEALRQLAK